MAKATDAGDCGCGHPKQRREQVMAGQILGSGWKDIVEEVFMKAGAAQARAQLTAQEQSTDGDVVVRVPMAVYITFPRNGEGISADKGLVGCVCTTTTDESGSVCVCVGACDFDACCDVDAGGAPIVAKS
jgi:hypothetical protein